MIQQNQKFFSYIESRVQEKGELYARFHLGIFLAGQALTVANALRRTLLAEIPGVVVTTVQIEGVHHEFATLPGVQENVLNIVLNLKKMVLTLKQTDFETIAQQRQELVACLNISGPSQVTAADIKFPAGITPVWPDHPIATLGSTGTLKMNVGIQCIDPVKQDQTSTAQTTGVVTPLGATNIRVDTQKLLLNTAPNPVKQVNYGIRQVEGGTGEEYISLEIWTDGSLDPKYALDYALEKLTRMFYTFTTLNKNVVNSNF